MDTQHRGLSALRIALVSPYDAHHPGGVTEHVQHLAEQFRLLGHAVKMIAPSSRQRHADRYFIPVGRVTPVAVNGSVARVSLSLTLAPRIRAILQREHFDIVHIHEPLAPTLPTTFLSCSDRINVGTFHAAGTRSLGYSVAQSWLLKLAPRLKGRIAVSPAARDFASRYFPAEYTIIPNGVDVATYSKPAVHLAKFDDDRPKVLFVGRFNEERKGFRHFLEAMVLVQHVLPQAQLLIAGGGDPTPFGAFIRQSKLRHVHFLGYVTKQQLAALYHSATVFCAPSTGQESFGIVLLEAMAAGCPIVAADNPGYRNVLEHRRQGLLVAPRNSEALAVGLLQLLQDPTTCARMAEQGRIEAGHYAWDHIAARILRFYTDLMV